jgi:hypothetical protein
MATAAATPNLKQWRDAFGTMATPGGRNTRRLVTLDESAEAGPFHPLHATAAVRTP